MSYVPIVVPPSTPSPRTRELADELARVLVAFEQKHPTVTRGEMTEATRLALQATRGSSNVAPLTATLVGLVVAAALGVFVFLEQSGAIESIRIYSVVGVVAALVIVLALVAVLRRQP